MILKHCNKRLSGQLIITINEAEFDWDKSNSNNMVHILWNQSDKNVLLNVDGYEIVLGPKSATTSTFHHHVSIVENAESLVIFSFNKEFYCTHDHDSEISCNGIIFFGAQEQSVISLNEHQNEKLDLLLKVFIDEFEYQDSIQSEMLLALLKRLIIMHTRLVKVQNGFEQSLNDKVDIVREFNYLVDMHFKKIKTVKEYADLMYKSPKTLSNLFSKIGDKSPLQIIHHRIVLEARRLLYYSDYNINEISFELGFEEPATFFKLFKKHMNESPQTFRNNLKKNNLGIMAI